jgi:hypothetical protein
VRSLDPHRVVASAYTALDRIGNPFIQPHTSTRLISQIKTAKPDLLGFLQSAAALCATANCQSYAECATPQEALMRKTEGPSICRTRFVRTHNSYEIHQIVYSKTAIFSLFSRGFFFTFSCVFCLLAYNIHTIQIQ